MDFTLSNAPEYVITNIRTVIRLWAQRFNLINKFEIGTYSRHLLLIISDLYEEIQNNQKFFSSNQYGKKFFEIHISSYCGSKNKSSKLDNLKQKWTREVNQELSFIKEALSHSNKLGGKFGLEDIPLLLQCVEEKITSTDSLEAAIQLLGDTIFEEQPTIELLEFLVDTIILLFNRQGLLAIERLFKYQFESFEDIYDDGEGKLYPKIWGVSGQNSKTIEEYREILNLYYENLTIRDRLLFLKEIYCRKHEEFKIIFNTTGLKLVSSFYIGDVHFYNPVKDGKYIKETEFLNFEDSECCIAVKVQGADSTSMKIQAKHMAERALAGLSIRGKQKQAITLSTNFLMCDDEGKMQGFAFSAQKPNSPLNPNNSSDSQNYYSRLGKWISAGNKCNPSASKWLSSIELRRKATESSDSSKELLDSWFSVEKFSEESKSISIRVPEPSDEVKKISHIKENLNSWIGDENLKSIQLILVFCELRFQIINELNNSALKFCDSMKGYRPDEVKISEYIPQDLFEQIYSYEDSTLKIQNFLEKLGEIKQRLEDARIEIPFYIKKAYDIFYNNSYCEKYLFEKIYELKDDIYNIYRIRNMLVHSSGTQSKLLDYYSQRIREYSFSFLQILGNKLFKTSEDSEIKSLESYLREIIIDSNIALEAVKENQMNKFIKMIFEG